MHTTFNNLFNSNKESSSQKIDKIKLNESKNSTFNNINHRDRNLNFYANMDNQFQKQKPPLSEDRNNQSLNTCYPKNNQTKQKNTNKILFNNLNYPTKQNVKNLCNSFQSNENSFRNDTNLNCNSYSLINHAADNFQTNNLIKLTNKNKRKINDNRQKTHQILDDNFINLEKLKNQDKSHKNLKTDQRNDKIISGAKNEIIDNMNKDFKDSKNTFKFNNYQVKKETADFSSKKHVKIEPINELEPNNQIHTLNSLDDISIIKPDFNNYKNNNQITAQSIESMRNDLEKKISERSNYEKYNQNQQSKLRINEYNKIHKKKNQNETQEQKHNVKDNDINQLKRLKKQGDKKAIEAIDDVLNSQQECYNDV